MKTNIIAIAATLSDRDLLARLDVLASTEREVSVELVAHLAALDSRPAVFAAQGFGSIFGYCTGALRLSEDAACTRITAARASRRFPVILDQLASGALTLTAVRIFARYLTPENHETILAKASRRTLREIDLMVAELAPRPDVPSSVRRLPAPAATPTAAPNAPAKLLQEATSAPTEPAHAIPALASVAPPSRAIVHPTAPERYRVQFAIGRETHEKLRRLQALLRREIPNGDPGAIFDRALTVLLEKVERAKLAAAARPRAPRAIRSETDKVHKPARPSRYVPREVRREVWKRDGGQCTFVGPSGRCRERTFLELHHVQPYAKQGPATVSNIALRCRRHNQYEAELIFGPHVLDREGGRVSRSAP